MVEQRPMVRRSAVVPVSKARVWSALTEPAELSRWFGAEVELDPRPGGSGRFTDGKGIRHAKVTGVRWGERLDFVWWPEGTDPGVGGSDVSFEVEESPEGTRVVVTERAPAPVDMQASVAASAAFTASARWTSRVDRLGAQVLAVSV